MKKILTLVINIANDKYYDDLFYRVQKALDHNLYFLSKLKDKNKIEIIYVDWGSKKAISDFIFVNKEFTNQVKFIHVNEKIAKRLSKGYPNFFNHDTSYNVGYLRSNGKNIFQTASDQFFTTSSWQNLINFIKKEKNIKNAALLVPRKIIDKSLYKLNLSSEEYSKILYKINSTNYNYKSHGFYEGGGFSTLMTKINYFKLKGYIEKMEPGTASDGELTLRYDLLGLDKLNSDNFGIFMYKFPPLEGSLRNKLVYSKMLRKSANLPKSYLVNDNNWGLKTLPLKKKSSKNVSNNFNNSKKYENLLPKLDDLNKSTYKILLQSKNFYWNSFSSLKNIYLIYNIIIKHKIYNYIEFGFKSPFITDIIGNNFKFLNIINIDYDKKNNDKGYLKRTNKVVKIFNTSRYGPYKTLFPKKVIELKMMFNKYLKTNQSTFLTINYENNLFCETFLNKILKKNQFQLSFSFILILNYDKNSNYFEKNFKKKYNIHNLKSNNLLLIDRCIKEKVFSKSEYLSISQIIPYIFYIFHKTLGLTYDFVKSFIYGFIR